MSNQSTETPATCEDCLPVKHWATATPYVDVRLCPLHAAAEEMRTALVQIKQALAGTQALFKSAGRAYQIADTVLAKTEGGKVDG